MTEQSSSGMLKQDRKHGHLQRRPKKQTIDGKLK